MSSRKNNETTIYSYADLDIKNSSIVIVRESIKVSTDGFVGLMSRSERSDNIITSLILLRITKSDDSFNVEIKTNKEPININTKTDNFEVKKITIAKIEDIPTTLKKYGLSPMMLQKLATVNKKKTDSYLMKKIKK
jgi:hypothetical protein